jgi:uncharacterized iron-regulated protein
MHPTTLAFIGFVTTVLLTTGCAPTAHRCALWVDVYTGEPIDQADMLDELAEADVIYLGERHTVDRHHELQHAVVAGLIERNVELVLGLEMLWHTHQDALDRYNAGELTFDELAAEVNWEKVWNNYEDYRPIVEAAHAAGMPVIGLNAPGPAVKGVFRQGLAGLDPALRAQLPDVFHLEDPVYEQHLNQVMMTHAHVTEEMVRRMFEAQVARDETMANRLARYLQSPAGAGRTAVVLCGAGHCAHGLGTPYRVKQRLPDARQRIIVMSESGDVELSPAMRKMARDIEISHEERQILTAPIANYLHVVQMNKEE